MKWLKGLLIFVGFIIFVFAIGLVLIVIYKKEILAEVSSQLKSAIRAEVIIGDADITLFQEFPNFTLKLDDVVIKDPSARAGDKDLLTTKTILVNVRTYKLFYKEIEFRNVRIIDGEFYVFRNKAGYSNLDVFKNQKDKPLKDSLSSADSTRNFRLTNERVFFQDLRFTWHDSLKEKYIGFVMREVDSDINHFDSLIACRMNGRIDFDELTFNPDRGSFLKNQSANVSLAFNFFTDTKQLRVEPSMLSLHESELHLEGNVDFASKNIVLDISSERLLYSEGLAVLPETLARKLSRFSILKPFGIFVHLDAPLGQAKQPFVGMRFDLADNIFKSNVVTITDLSLDGVMTNRQDTTKEINNANSTVHLNNVIGKIDELPFEATAVLSDFSDLVLDIHSKHKVTLPMMNREVDTTSVRFTKGNFVSEFHYVGKMSEYFDPATGTYKGDLEGKATIEKGAFTLVERKLDFKDFDMTLHFNEDTMWIDKLGIGIDKSYLNLTGTMINYVPYFTKANKGFVKLKITSPNIDMQNFLAKRSSKSSKKVSKQDKKKTSDMIEALVTMLQFDIDVNIDKLKNKSFTATNISGKLKLNENTLKADNVKMTLGGGKLNFSLTMKDLQNDITPMDVKAYASGIGIKDMFRSFNNFNQKSITDENLEGKISFDTRIKVKLNDDFNLMLPTFSGDMNWVLKDGRLINVEAMHNMSNFLFRKRDFDDIHFAQINGKFNLTHRYLDISRMEVQSTVLSIFLEGRYSLDDDTNISVQVPLSNLKKRDKDFVPQNVGVDAKVGPSVYLLAKTDSSGKTDISYQGLKFSDKKASDKKKEKKKKGK